MAKLSSKSRKYYIYDLDEEERMTRFFNTLDEADEALALFAGLESKKDISMYLRNPNCKYEIRATTKQN